MDNLAQLRSMKFAHLFSFCVILWLPNSLAVQGVEIPDSIVIRHELINKDLTWTIDSLMRLGLFRFTVKEKEQKKGPSDDSKTNDIANLPDMLFEYRFEEMNRISAIHFDYNPFVRKYIELYAGKRKESFSRILGLAKLYFPLFEEYLEKYRLPLELKYLPVVESALNPVAKSSSDAIGLWQIKINAAKMFNLEVNSLIDERMDPGKSTEAACQYLDYLYSIFRDWHLALAAFNGGPGVVRNAIQRSGGKTNFWEIRSFMPVQTQDYVPAFMAIAYMMNYAALHNIEPVDPDYDFWHTDTVMISYPLQFRQISEIINVPVDALRFLNPMYKSEMIPEMEHPMMLMLPSDKVLAFIRHENDILGKKVELTDYHTVRELSSSTRNKIRDVYIVKNGDFLHKIAFEHGCTIEDIRSWNSLKNDTLKPGQQIVVWVPVISRKSSDTVYSSHALNSVPKDTTFKIYKVKRGETLWTIAGKFRGTTVDEIRKANQINDEKSLKPGQKIKIPIHE
jgi:membrane-bound lytic murein transglycosylase D